MDTRISFLSGLCNFQLFHFSSSAHFHTLSCRYSLPICTELISSSAEFSLVLPDPSQACGRIDTSKGGSERCQEFYGSELIEA